MSPVHIEAARQWLASGAAGQSAEDGAAIAGRAYERLCLHLAPLIGDAGVHALFVRSARLLAAEYVCLAPLARTGPPEHLAGRLRDCVQEQGPAEVSEATAALFAAFFGLLATFIGERLTAQVLEGARPQLGGHPEREP